MQVLKPSVLFWQTESLKLSLSLWYMKLSGDFPTMSLSKGPYSAFVVSHASHYWLPASFPIWGLPLVLATYTSCKQFSSSHSSNTLQESWGFLGGPFSLALNSFCLALRLGKIYIRCTEKKKSEYNKMKTMSTGSNFCLISGSFFHCQVPWKFFSL